MSDERIVLLVEDNPDDEELALMAFRRSNLGNRVFVVRDGAEALDFLFGTGDYAARNTGDVPTIVLLDLNLPKVDGLEVLHRMRQNVLTKSVPVLVLVSSKEDQAMVSSHGFGSVTYMRKPLNFERLVTASKQLGLSWLLVDEPQPS